MATSMSVANFEGCRNLLILSQHQSRVRVTLPRSIEALRHPLQTARLSRAFSQPPRQQYARRRGIAATTAKRDGGSGDEGDPDLQDNLVSMLRLQIGKKHVDAFVDAEEEKLKQSVEEAKAEFDELAELTRKRADLSFDSALADINQSADEFEAQLRKSRQDMEADQANFEDWEEQMVVDRSRGQFFKNLYKAEQKPPKEAAKGALRDPRGARFRAETVRAGAAAEVHSPFRLYVFSFLAAVLLIAASADAAGRDPSTQRDVLYGMLGVGMGASALWERSVLPQKSSITKADDDEMGL